VKQFAKAKQTRVVKTWHSRRRLAPEQPFERDLARHLVRLVGAHALAELYARYAHGEAAYDALMRRIVMLALLRRLGRAVEFRPGVRVRHPETFSIGDGVHIGDDTLLAGRVGGRCVIGRRAWIGPHCFIDARDLRIGEEAGLAPGVRIIGSLHTSEPVGVPIIRTPLWIAPVRIGRGAVVASGAVILPGVTIGQHAWVGAGAVVTRDVPPYAIVAGVPAKKLRDRRKRRPRGR